MKAKKDLKKKLKPVAKKTAAPVNAKKETAQKAVKKAIKPAAKKAVKAVVNKVQKAEKIVKKAVKKVEKKAVAAVKKKEEAIKKTVKKVAAKVTKPQKPAETNTAAKVTQPAAAAVKKPVSAAKKAVKEESETLTQAEIKEIEIHLLALREEVRARIKNKKEHEMPETEAGDEADVASQSLDKEVLFELNDNSQAMLDQIESALRRINKGIYGTCEYCRCKIPKKRILALPFARYCIRCQTSNEGIKR